MPLCEPPLVADFSDAFSAAVSPLVDEPVPPSGRYHVRCVDVEPLDDAAGFAVRFQVCDGLPRGHRGQLFRVGFPEPDTLPLAAAERERSRRSALALATRLLRPHQAAGTEHLDWSALAGRQCVVGIAISPGNAGPVVELVESQIHHVFDPAATDVPKHLGDLLECRP